MPATPAKKSAAAEPHIEIWSPTRETFSDPELQRIHTHRMARLKAKAPAIQGLIAEHLPEHGITKVDIIPGRPEPAAANADGDVDYRMVLHTDKPLYQGDGAGSVTPVINGIAKATENTAMGQPGLYGVVQGRLPELAQHLDRSGLVKLNQLERGGR